MLIRFPGLLIDSDLSLVELSLSLASATLRHHTGSNTNATAIPAMESTLRCLHRSSRNQILYFVVFSIRMSPIMIDDGVS